jgi:MFS family permease
VASSVPWLLAAAVLTGIGIGVGYVQSLALSLAVPASAAAGAGRHEAVLGAGNALIAPAAGFVANLFDARGLGDGALWFGLSVVLSGTIHAVFRLRALDAEGDRSIVTGDRSPS